MPSCFEMSAQILFFFSKQLNLQEHKGSDKKKILVTFIVDLSVLQKRYSLRDWQSVTRVNTTEAMRGFDASVIHLHRSSSFTAWRPTAHKTHLQISDYPHDISVFNFPPAMNINLVFQGSVQEERSRHLQEDLNASREKYEKSMQEVKIACKHTHLYSIEIHVCSPKMLNTPVS